MDLFAGLRFREGGEQSGRLRGLGIGGECKPVHQHVLIPESHNLGLVILTGFRLEHPLMQQALHQRLAPPPTQSHVGGSCEVCGAA